MHVVKPSTTGQTRFDYLTMQQEWTDHLANCGYETVEPDLVAALVNKHHELFSLGLAQTDVPVLWDDLEGAFAFDPLVILAYGGIPLTREDLDGIWANAFDYTDELFEEIEQRVHEERSL